HWQRLAALAAVFARLAVLSRLIANARLARTSRAHRAKLPLTGIHQRGLALGQQTRDFFERLFEEILFAHGADELSLAIDRALAASAREAHVGVHGFARAIDHAAHNGDLNRRLHLGEPLLHLIGDLEDVDLNTTARW